MPTLLTFQPDSGNKADRGQSYFCCPQFAPSPDWIEKIDCVVSAMYTRG